MNSSTDDTVIPATTRPATCITPAQQHAGTTPKPITRENDLDEVLEQNMDLLVRYYLALNYPQPRLTLKELVRALEKHAIREMLQLTHGRQKRAAELLGLMETTFCEKIKRYGIRNEMRSV